MQFFQSLLCTKGNDNRSRFIAINLSLYLIFIFLSALSTENTVFSLVILITSAVFSAFSVIRRLNDAGLNNNWMPISTGLFLVCGLIIVFTGYAASYWLLLLPFGFLALLLTYPSSEHRYYILGYVGPVDLSKYKAEVTDHSRRIEPSFIGQGNDDVTMRTPTNEFSAYTNSNANVPQRNSTNDIGEQIRELLFNNKNAVITFASVLLLALIGILVSSILSSSNSSEGVSLEQEPSPVLNVTSTNRLHAIEFPDNFTLMISEHSGLFIHWEADTTEQSIIWSQETAKGDDTCSEITFNNKKSLRTLSVAVENGSNYYASFSPLDTSSLLNDLAYRGSFTLCGYKFSLKGSQAILGKNPPYSEFVEY